MIVNFAIIHDNQIVIQGGHGLATTLNIDHGKPSMSKPQGGFVVFVGAFTVGTPMRQDLNHATQISLRPRAEESGNPAHQFLEMLIVRLIS